jgi:hypothetical protein
MKTQACFAAVFVAVSVGVTVLAQGLNVRPGTWEFNMVMQGAIPLEGVPPAARAQLEAEMRKPHTYKSCMTPEDIKALKLGKPPDDSDDEDCKVVTSKMTGTSGDIVRQCTGDNPRTETAHFEAPTPQSLKANISSKAAAGTSTMAITGKWLSADCKE